MLNMQEEPPVAAPEGSEPVTEEIGPSTIEPNRSQTSASHWRRFKAWYGGHKKWSIPATILLILVILFLIPFTRYHLASLFIKKNFTVQVNDATANTPVSGAVVTIGAISATTNGNGQAILYGVKVGDHQASVTKTYYQDKSTELLVPILNQKSTPSIDLTATGRQVKIKVTNSINSATLAGVNIVVANATAKTDSSGSALLVLPADATTQKGKLSLIGYNDVDAVVQVSNSSVKENDFTLTPSGKVYFLSNQTGKLNLMKANLDGSAAEVAVAATGNEQVSNTSVMQSPDGKYVALITKRNASDKQPQLYVLAASDDKLLQADSGNAIFQLYAWSGDTLVYTVQRQDLPDWQQGASKIKAYNATTGGTTLLDQTAGSDATIAANEYYSEVMVSGNSVIYGKIWQGDGDFSAKQNTLQTIGTSGQNHQILATYNSADNVYFAQHSPDSLYIWKNTGSSDTYYQYTVGGSVQKVSITNDQFYQGQTTYYYSPDNSQTFWADSRDGKNTLLVGDQSGLNTSTVASLSDYDASGWYTNQYLLVSKNSSELYIMGVKGGTLLKIASYQSTSNNGY